MKKTLLFMIILLCVIPLNINAETDLPYLKPKCPDTETLVKSTDSNKEELLNKLNELIPVAYPFDIYNEWIIKEALPLRSLIGVPYDDAYYKMAQKLCNKKVADYSWLVKVQFPKLLPSTSASGVMFIVNTKDKGWYVWYTYR
ncbi:hypothetical protein M4D55_20530 [Metabacillus idriensis]|uniref:hypothetical protein n=1 Tax=Metabacillus idriensis TaxID=324768 RepID=UPI0008A8D378|nr:hypothetical protein [Metabacillus idriensis]MCM3598152.1 hypothetical protein [Metabacillus idriensis]OHR63740.1 hypothetical protein HMPREF3291_03435 [Bacillus sp. HMSC76G11]